MSIISDALKNAQANYQPIERQLVKAGNFSFIKPHINLVVTHNNDNINDLILSSLENSQDKIICIDINCSLHDFKCDSNHIKIDAQNIDNIYKCIKDTIQPNSVIVILNFENIIIDINTDSEMENPLRASIISQFFKRMVGMMGNNNSMMIIGHKSPAYEFYRDGNISPYPNSEGLLIPKIPSSVMIFLASTVTKITTKEDKLDIEVLKHLMEPIGKRETV